MRMNKDLVTDNNPPEVKIRVASSSGRMETGDVRICIPSEKYSRNVSSKYLIPSQIGLLSWKSKTSMASISVS